MKIDNSLRIAFATTLIACFPVSLLADEQADEAAIRSNIAAYVEAFNARDAAAVAAMWAVDAIYENPATGDLVTGRDEIEKELEQIFAESGESKLEVEIRSIRFLAPQVALEDGIARVLTPDASPDITSYTAVHVRTDGKWLIGRMSEQPVVEFPSNYSRLMGLEWMLGSWVDQDEDAVVETTCQWTKNQNFLMRSFKVTIGEEIDLSGMQFIGWDPVNERIRSWAFDSDGGFAEATWMAKGESWVVSSKATLPDGRQSTAVNTMTPIDENSFTWQSTGRELGGEILPNIKPITITRKTVTE